MDEVPCFERTLLAFDEQQTLPPEDEEVLLRALAVIETPGLAGLEDADVDPELLELRLALEDPSPRLSGRGRPPSAPDASGTISTSDLSGAIASHFESQTYRLPLASQFMS